MMLGRVLAAFRKRPPGAEHPDEPTARKRAKLEADGVQDGDQERHDGVPDGVPGDPPAPEEPGPDGAAALALLECPVCVDTMQPPVRQCVNGHCVCNPCRTRVSSCPLCRGPLSFSTHAALDHLARTLTLRCVHAQCTDRILVRDRESHLLECQFNVVACPLGQCSWTGPFQRVGGHCVDQHPLQTRTAALDDNVCIRQDVAADKVDEVQCLTQLGDVAVLIGAEVFLLEVHGAELPGRVAVLCRQLSAGRPRPPPYHCLLAVRSRGKPQSVLSANVPVVGQDETLVPVVEAGRCLVLDLDAVKRLGVEGAGTAGRGGGLVFECRVTVLPTPVTSGWLSWLADKFWPR